MFTLFFFILFGNLMGVFPLFFTFTSHIAVTLALSLFVFILVTVVALKLHGLHFFSYFVPKGVPVVLLPLMVVIEVISYLSRIISLSVRLFANMMAGHVMLEVFAGFVVMLGAAGGFSCCRQVCRWSQRHPGRLRTAGGFVAGLRLRHPDLHLSARRGASALISSRNLGTGRPRARRITWT